MQYYKKFLIFFILFFIPTYSFADDYSELLNKNDMYVFTATTINNDIPSINARYSVVIDRASNTILFGKAENEKCKMASTTKIMTCIIVLENCTNIDEIISISKKASNIGGSRLGLNTNDKISVKDLLYGLMMVSGNDAAVALAEHIAGSVDEFANLMNKKALDLGLQNTNFLTPHGLDQDEHYTTAYELAQIANYALNNSIFLQIVSTNSYTISINNVPKNLKNTNELLNYFEGIYGVKTGFTNGANRCLVTACKRNNLDIVCVVLGCDTKKNRTLDSINIINYIYSNFTVFNLKEKIMQDFNTWKSQKSQNFMVNKGTSNSIDMYIEDNTIPFDTIALKNNSDISIDFNVSNFYNSPLYSKTPIGKLVVNTDGTYLFSIDILNSNTINKKDIFFYLKFFLHNYFNFFVDNTIYST